MKILKVLLCPDRILAKGVIWLIKLYQKTISPDHSKHGETHPFKGCKFYPSCSAYAILVLEKDGFVFGLPKIIWRVLRCNPWNQGGVDMP